MYDMYPDWGPARHRDEYAASDATEFSYSYRDRARAGYWHNSDTVAAEATPEPARAGGQRPDDN
jgi:hypothetical protein